MAISRHVVSRAVPPSFIFGSVYIKAEVDNCRLCRDKRPRFPFKGDAYHHGVI